MVSYLPDARGMISSEDINHPTSQNIAGEKMRRVIKHGHSSKCTIGTMSKFISYVRKYDIPGNMNSLEIAIFPRDENSTAFSKKGDSGSAVVDGFGRFVGIITGGYNTKSKDPIQKDRFDITYCTHMDWIWSNIKGKYKGANLDFGNLDKFIADV